MKPFGDHNTAYKHRNQVALSSQGHRSARGAGGGAVLRRPPCHTLKEGRGGDTALSLELWQLFGLLNGPWE